MTIRPTILVLAAGLGGGSHRLPEVLGTTVRHAIETQLPVLVVTTCLLAPMAFGQLAMRDVLVVTEDDADRGMGHLIATAVPERGAAPGWLVLPGDMPHVRPASLCAVAAALEQHAVVFAQHRGRRGHPVGFGAELYSELVMLAGDGALRRLIARYPAHGLEVDDPGVLAVAPADADRTVPDSAPMSLQPGPAQV